MQSITRVLMLKLEQGLSMSRVAAAVGVGKATVHDILRRADAAGVGWPLPEGMDEDEIHARLYPKRPASGACDRLTPDFDAIRAELTKPRKRRGPHLTRTLLWEEYCEEARAVGKEPYSYAWFCDHLADGVGVSQSALKMRFDYPPGEYLMTDFSGKTLPLVGPGSPRSHAEIFVAVLPWSQKVFVHAVASQTVQDWTLAHRAAFEFFKGVPTFVIHDNLPAGVTDNRGLDGLVLNKDFRMFCEHYGTVSLPTRKARPRDKGAVEAAVGFVGTALLAALRRRNFFTCDEMNAAFQERLSTLNARRMKAYGKSRDDLFAEERALLKALPARRWEWAAWHRRKVGLDYHVTYDKRHYSVPWSHAGKPVQVRVGERTLEIFSEQGGQRLAVHRLGAFRGRFCTERDHMPSHHRDALELRVPDLGSWLLAKASQAGPAVLGWAYSCMDAWEFPEQSFRTIRGVVSLADKHPRELVNAACEDAILEANTSYGYVRDWLGKARKAEARARPDEPIPPHDNVRGGAHYRQRGARARS